MSTTLQKVFQPDNNGPDDKFLVERVPDAQHFYVYHDRPGGERVGVVEVAVAYTDASGTFAAAGPLVTWTLPEAMTGYKYRKDYRVTATVRSDAVCIRREEKQTASTLSDANEYDWRETARWEITHDGIEEVSPTADGPGHGGLQGGGVGAE